MAHPEARGAVFTPVDTFYNALVAFPIACFTLALLTDLAYIQTVYLMWHHFSAWLILAGLVGGGFAAVAWLIRLAVDRRRASGLQALVNIAVLVVALFNSLVHAGDGWTGIVPWGVTLSAVTVVLMILSGVLGARKLRHLGGSI